MKNERTPSFTGLALTLLLALPTHAQNTNFELAGSAKAIFTQAQESVQGYSPETQTVQAASDQQTDEVVSKCRSRNSACYRALYGDGKMLTEKLRKVQDLYTIISLGCPKEGVLDIAIWPMHQSEGGERDMTSYEVVDEDYSGNADFSNPWPDEAHERIHQLSTEGFQATPKRDCDEYPARPGMVLLEIQARASN